MNITDGLSEEQVLQRLGSGGASTVLMGFCASTGTVQVSVFNRGKKLCDFTGKAWGSSHGMSWFE
jgi:hypothetical protein